ncbi:MAG: hypothetical protein ACRCWP_08190 [Shewanella sp.]
MDNTFSALKKHNDTKRIVMIRIKTTKILLPDFFFGFMALTVSLKVD